MAKHLKYLGGAFNLKTVADGEDGPILEDDVYNGHDHAKGKDGAFTLGVGDETTVSDECAAAIDAKFPGCFEVDGKKRAKPRRRGGKAEADENED